MDRYCRGVAEKYGFAPTSKMRVHYSDLTFVRIIWMCCHTAGCWNRLESTESVRTRMRYFHKGHRLHSDENTLSHRKNVYTHLVATKCCCGPVDIKTSPNMCCKKWVMMDCGRYIMKDVKEDALIQVYNPRIQGPLLHMSRNLLENR